MSTKNTIDIEKLRQKYVDNPPEGYTKAEIQRMRDEDLLDMDYFLYEDSYDLDDWG